MTNPEPGTEKIAILIDGNNFFKGLERSIALKNLNLDEFDYEQFILFLAQERSIAIKRFYKGVIRKEIGNTKSQGIVMVQ